MPEFNATRELIDLEHARLHALTHADASTLWSLHHPDFLLCTPDGVVWDRDNYLGDLCDDYVSFTRFQPVTDIDVLQSGDLAVLRYRSLIDFTTTEGRSRLHCWHSETYVREPGLPWRNRWAQATDTTPA